MNVRNGLVASRVRTQMDLYQTDSFCHAWCHHPPCPPDSDIYLHVSGSAVDDDYVIFVGTFEQQNNSFWYCMTGNCPHSGL